LRLTIQLHAEHIKTMATRKMKEKEEKKKKLAREPVRLVKQVHFLHPTAVHVNRHGNIKTKES